MTDKQIIYLDYLLKRLGFAGLTENSDVIDCINESLSRETSYLWKVKRLYNLIDPQNDDNDFAITAIDFLQLEYILRRKSLVRYAKPAKNCVSASDLNAYVFCPASFSIANSVNVPPTISEIEGSKLHETLQLKRVLEQANHVGFRKDATTNQSKIIEQMNRNHSRFYNDIRNAQLVYCGHETDQVKAPYFVNERYRYAGQPDYILKDSVSQQHFVVEEKFHYRKYYNSSKNMYANHLAQLASYICFINDPLITHGHLIHWVYDYKSNDGSPYIYYIDVRTLQRSDDLTNRIASLVDKVWSFIDRKSIFFDTSANSVKKCMRCSYRIWCGHKTRLFDKVSFPYSGEYTQLKPCPFPIELKKNYKETVVFEIADPDG